MTTASTALPASAANLRNEAGVIGLVGIAHLVSHFSQLLLAPLFPWLKEAFHVGYIELGALMTVFFVVSCAVQTSSGFLVDRFGPRPILFTGLTLLAVAAFGFASSPNYGTMAFFAVIAGIGNGVFHPVDYTILNRKVSTPRLGHAYSVHGVTGSLGWAAAPALVLPIAINFSWRAALVAAGCVVVAVLAVVWFNRDKLELPPTLAKPAAAKGPQESSFAFLRIPAVWMCFAFFFVYAIIISVVQAFAPEAARQLHDVPRALAASFLTVYMVCSAGGMVLGGFLASDPARCERVVGAAFGGAAVVALVIGLAPVPALAVPVLFGVMGFAAGIAGPSRDLLVKRSTPENSTGRVYGVVYSGLDIGQAFSPLVFGALMDHHNYRGVWLGLVAVQAVLIVSAFNVRKARRTTLVPA
ncbi:MFS transporter [Ramlibacter sp. G-1-2-2]|uniref:MFS transporter n=1 Tax=Ramlibacter agri TaxID=2728837 RepID=A0A848H7S6_9BURK|nr:MFS transporter [Ramlibacter agri]NML45982.1 MFS transporter [Ramlibacter agri]